MHRAPPPRVVSSPGCETHFLAAAEALAADIVRFARCIFHFLILTGRLRIIISADASADAK